MVVSVARFLEQLTLCCKQTSGFLGLVLSPQDNSGELALTAVCTARGLPAFAQALPGAAAQCGPLAGHLAEEGSHILLYAEQPHLVTLSTVVDSEFAGLRPRDLVVWEWNRSLSTAKRGGGQDIGPLLQAAESRFWVQLYRAALLARQNRLLEAADLCAELRNRLLLPLLSSHNSRPAGSPEYRAGEYAGQLAATHPQLGRESILDALEAARQIYFALRYELAGPDFLRNEEAELLATELLAVEDGQ